MATRRKPRGCWTRFSASNSQVAAIVAAAGRGRRTHSATLKQFRDLGGRPLIAYSLDVLSEASCTPIVLVVPPSEVEAARATTASAATRVTAGGETRQESVRRGLELVGTDLVVVHDAARPFITAQLVLDCVEALEDADAAIAAVPVDETLKRVDDSLVSETVDRAGMWRIQTPQAFRTEALRAAHERARDDGYDATDDAQLIERAGGRVVVVPGLRDNIKLTFPEDFVLAETILKARRG